MQYTNLKEIKMYCPNCGQLLTGYKRDDGTVFMKCSKCYATLCSKLINKNKATIKVEYPF